MARIRILIIVFFLMTVSILGVSPNINVQFLIGDSENGTFQGEYHVTFGLFNAPNVPFEDALWKETHKLIITQGQISQILGQNEPLDYHLFKSDSLYIGLSFQELTDTLYVPLISVPAAVVSKYSIYAQEIEYTNDWLKINTENYRVGIGITQNLTVPFQVIGSADVTTLRADSLHSPDGSNIHNIDYLKLSNVDDFSLSPYDEIDAPTVDVVFVTTERNVGIGIYVTADIKEQLHVMGNLRIDNGGLRGTSNIELSGDGGATEESYNNVNQFIWDSNKGFIHAGYSGNNRWSRSNSGIHSAAFGRDNKVSGDYGFSVGLDNEVLKEASSIGGGRDNKVDTKYSGVFSGQNNSVSHPTTTAYHTLIKGGSVIVTGLSNSIVADHAFIGGGELNEIQDSAVVETYTAILTGKENKILGEPIHSVILGGHNNTLYGDHSLVFGRNVSSGLIGTETDGVFIFTDSTITDSNPFVNLASDQFLIYATNGVSIGFNDFNIMTDSIELDEFSPSLYYPPVGEQVKDHTIRTAGDIVAVDKDGNLGYIVADGSFLTNIQSLWKNDTLAASVYVDDKRVGIGAVNNLVNEDVLLYLKETATYPVNVRWETLNGDTMDIGLTSSSANISSSVPLKLQFDGNDVLEVSNTDSGELIIHKNLGLGVLNPDHALDVSGDVEITGHVISHSLEVSTTITANSFVGDGSQLTDVPVYYMSPQDGSPFKQLVMNSSGQVGIGTVTNNIQNLLHIGDDTGSQIRIQETDDVNLRYTDFASSSRFDLTFFNYVHESDQVFSFNSQKNSSNSVSQLMVITGEGNVGIGTSPSHPLHVDGNIYATTFEGNGSSITNIQLDVAQTGDVTFNATVSLNDVLKLNPVSSIPACDQDAIGSIFSVQPSGKTLTICVCVADDTVKNLLDSSANADCEAP